MVGVQVSVTPMEHIQEAAGQNEAETFLGKLDTMVNRVQLFQDRFASKKPKYLMTSKIRQNRLMGMKKMEKHRNQHFHSPGDFDMVLKKETVRRNNDSKRSKLSIKSLS